MPTGISSQVKHISAKIKRNETAAAAAVAEAAAAAATTEKFGLPKKNFSAAADCAGEGVRGRLRQRQQLMLIAQRGQMPAASAASAAAAAK